VIVLLQFALSVIAGVYNKQHVFSKAAAGHVCVASTWRWLKQFLYALTQRIYEAASQLCVMLAVHK
jgi:hypothetical protein